jgi:adenylylsulfate kinase
MLIYVHASFESCQKRDVKGHYFKANKGLITNFTGVSSTFEEPIGGINKINTEELSIEEATQKCIEIILNSCKCGDNWNRVFLLW